MVIALIVEAASTSEKLVNLYQTAWNYNPEDSCLHSENRLVLSCILFFFQASTWSISSHFMLNGKHQVRAMAELLPAPVRDAGPSYDDVHHHPLLLRRNAGQKGGNMLG
jgi:hypothetical protein